MGALALIGLILGLLVALAMWGTARVARNDSRKSVTADEQAEILGRVGAQKEIEDELDAELRADPRRRATDRLRDEWSDK